MQKFSLHIKKTDINIQKINISKLEIFGIVIVFFLVVDKDRKFRFFEKTFFLSNINMDITLRILFFTLSNAEINFND